MINVNIFCRNEQPRLQQRRLSKYGRDVRYRSFWKVRIRGVQSAVERHPELEGKKSTFDCITKLYSEKIFFKGMSEFLFVYSVIYLIYQILRLFFYYICFLPYCLFIYQL